MKPFPKNSSLKSASMENILNQLWSRTNNYKGAHNYDQTQRITCIETIKKLELPFSLLMLRIFVFSKEVHKDGLVLSKCHVTFCKTDGTSSLY